MKITDIIKAARLKNVRNEADLLHQLRELADTAAKAGGGERANQQARAASILEAVNERMDASGCGYNEAWTAINRERPELFHNMQLPSGA